jgi:hypothetical protein|tara:strand:- start:95 stop:337 length:243 start_codon:yes stop_codon:yes gene_type:complete
MSKRIKKTTDEGWECVSELMDLVRLIDDELGHHFYEIKNCVRTQTTEEIVYEIKRVLSIGLKLIDEIDTDIEYKTIYDDE